MNELIFVENYLPENPTGTCENKFSSTPILLKHFRVLFTQMQEAKQNICSVDGQRYCCCLLDLIELELIGSIRVF